MSRKPFVEEIEDNTEVSSIKTQLFVISDELITAPMTFPLAFESWENGGTQISSKVFGEKAVEEFVEANVNSGSFANIHVCECMEELDSIMLSLFGER